MACDNQGTVSAAHDVLYLDSHIAFILAEAIPAGSLSAQNHY